jgi:hypothetical protein
MHGPLNVTFYVVVHIRRVTVHQRGNCCVSSCNDRYFRPRRTKNEAAQQFSVKLSNNKIHGNPFGSSPAATNGRCDFNRPSAGMPTCLAAAPLDTCVVLKSALRRVVFLQIRSHILKPEFPG